MKFVIKVKNRKSKKGEVEFWLEKNKDNDINICCNNAKDMEPDSKWYIASINNKTGRLEIAAGIPDDVELGLSLDNQGQIKVEETFPRKES